LNLLVPVETIRVIESPVAAGLAATLNRPPNLVKKNRRYTVVIADRRTGVYRRVGIRPLPVLLGLSALFIFPILVGLGLRWSATTEISDLRQTAERLELENRNFRTVTGTLTNEIQSLQSAITTLGDKSAVDGATAKAMDRLPAIVKSRAAGGPTSLFTPALRTPEDTFGALRDLLYRPRRPAATGADRRRAAPGTGGCDAVHLADARMADGLVRPPPRSLHR
jgi:hypothetical protein